MKLSQKWGGKFQRKNFKFLKLKFSPKFGGGKFQRKGNFNANYGIRRRN